ncbi:xylose isomerase domain protein TIM barrel [Arthrobacter sp. Hiyo8]|nr:xylose isomerase domain protein TIM barrel [Arthrobacter sp. Hiyo8]
MKPAMNQISTMQATFEEDLPAYAAAGFEAIGLLEMKLPEDDNNNRRLLDRYGFEVSNCIVSVLSILPLQGVVLPKGDWKGIDFEGPKDTETRIRQICDAVRRLGPYKPSSVTVSFGSPDGFESARAAETALREGLRRIADVATKSGVRIAIEPIHPSIIHTLGQSIAETAHIIDDAGVADAVGILIDTWHSGDSPTLFEDIGLTAIASSVCMCVTGHLPATPTAWCRERARHQLWKSWVHSASSAMTLGRTQSFSRRMTFGCAPSRRQPRSVSPQ